MALKFTIKIPSTVGSVLAAKVKPLIEKAFVDASSKIAALVVDRVTIEADTKLTSQAAQFKRAIQDPDAIKFNEKGIKISVKDPVVIALELGIESFDIKAKMLPHATHFSKLGVPYIDVPFLHSLTGKNAVPMAVVKSLRRAGKSAGEGMAVRGGQQGEKPRSFERTLTFGGKSVVTHVEHKAGIHDDMITQKTTFKNRKTATYKTIRRISGNSAPMSWWHPGFQGLGIFKKVFNEIKHDINRIVSDSFSRVGLKARFK